MKKLFFICIFLSINLQGQISESFEDSTFPPTGWNVSHTAGSSDWAQSTTYPHSGSKHANSSLPAVGSEKNITLNLSFLQGASTISYWIAVSSVGSTTVSTLTIKAGESLSNMITLRTINIEALSQAATYFNYVDYIEGTVNQSGNSIDLRGVNNAYISWIHNKISGGTAPSCRLDDIYISSATPLPVELVYFNANLTDNVVQLNWETATEINNYGFDIERTIISDEDEVLSDWQKIGFVKGNGNSSSPKFYSFEDRPFGGKEFKYRLKQIDSDGKFEYSNVILVSLDYFISNFELCQNYPNPFNPKTKIIYTIPRGTNVKITVYDMIGREITTLINKYHERGTYQVEFNGSKFSSGMYCYKLNAGIFSDVKKFILIK